MTSSSDTAPLWRYLRLNDFTRPSPTTKETVRKGVTGFWHKLIGDSKSAEPIRAQDELKRLSDELYTQIAPEPNWTERVTALNEALEKGLATRVSRVQIVIGAPFSGITETLEHWAQHRGIKIIKPPRSEAILNQDQQWLQCLEDEGSARPLVIPHLERCYLRHHHGLKLIRQLLQWLSTRPGYCVLGCSSWAWAYFSKALQAEKFFPIPWTLEALSQEHLQQWFGNLNTSQQEETFIFRQLDNGDFVIPPSKNNSFTEKTQQRCTSVSVDSDDTPRPEVSAFLTDLAAYSRGNPGVAWALWRQSLQVVPETENDNQDHAPDLDKPIQDHTIWVKPWSQIQHLTSSELADRSTLQILHTLLLHGPLPASLLIELLPLSGFEIRQVLTYLEHRSFLISAQEQWQLTPLGYPAVRQALEDEGYLVDPL
ncbi:hypothetical protein [Nitrosococcus watsonii]|uniref:Uncharacterized protein n=1 Tax=Nitrosococcus watsoni (strain C-113) TaxID=105559 RepID=D8K6Q7_NITWC|nr:hypothetical protein [Nitrosococcus watsonii]ADJ28584.1 conserved hypothetical protein [Nitrosococcus watsonii C-113]